MDNTNVDRVLKDLIETLEDGKKGFAQTAEKLSDSERSDLAGRMNDLASQRADFSSELHALANSLGIEMDESGSMAGDLHRGWMALKDALTGDDAHAVLAAAETGEDHAKREYTKALDEDLPENVRSVIARQASAIAAAHDEVRALRDNAAA